jgi:DHA1 family inner membrane transport protein
VSVEPRCVTRRQLFGSLFAMVFVVNLGRVVFAPLLEPLRTALSADAAAVGLLATLVWLGSAAPRVPTGYLLTKVPRHYVVFGAGTLLAAATGLASVASNVRALQAAGLLMGVATGAYFIAANPLVSELFPDRVGRALGIHGVGSQLAAVGAPLVVGLALSVGTWRTAFRLMTAGVLAATALFTVATWGTDLPTAGSEDRDMLGAVRAQWRIVVAGVVLVGAWGFVWQGVFNFYVSYLVGVKALTEPTARQVLSATFAAGVPAFAISGQLVDRLPVLPYILSVLGAFVALLVALTVTTGLWTVVAVSLGLGLVIHGLFPAVDTYLLGTLPDRHRASAYAAYSGSMMLIQAGGSWAVGTLRESAVAFDRIFQGFAGGLTVVLAVLVVGYLLGMLPTRARE